MVMKLAGIDVDAISVGGMRTCIQLPSFDLAFDMGVCPPKAVHRGTVLFTHAHVDHMGAVVQHCATRDLLGLKPPTYILPPKNLTAFNDVFTAWRALDHSPLEHTAIPLAPGETHAIKKGFRVQPFRSVHTVISQGYILHHRRQKLKPEYQHLTGPEIGAARARGEQITDEVDHPAVAFTGDTRIDVLDHHPELYHVNLLIMEVTFFGDQITVAQARRRGHIHLNEVAARAERFQNAALLLTHRSARHSLKQAEEEVRRMLPAELCERVTLLP
ncbi:MAG: MBL fold metallo-hydrolase [Myxococcota bacterium]